MPAKIKKTVEIKKERNIWPISAVIIAALLVSGGIYLRQKAVLKSEKDKNEAVLNDLQKKYSELLEKYNEANLKQAGSDEEKGKIEDQLKRIKENFEKQTKKYENPDLKISFDYPAGWGEARLSDDSDNNKTLAFSNKICANDCNIIINFYSLDAKDKSLLDEKKEIEKKSNIGIGGLEGYLVDSYSKDSGILNRTFKFGAADYLIEIISSYPYTAEESNNNYLFYWSEGSNSEDNNFIDKIIKEQDDIEMKIFYDNLESLIKSITIE